MSRILGIWLTGARLGEKHNIQIREAFFNHLTVVLLMLVNQKIELLSYEGNSFINTFIPYEKLASKRAKY